MPWFFFNSIFLKTFFAQKIRPPFLTVCRCCLMDQTQLDVTYWLAKTKLYWTFKRSHWLLFRSASAYICPLALSLDKTLCISALSYVSVLTFFSTWKKVVGILCPWLPTMHRTMTLAGCLVQQRVHHRHLFRLTPFIL